MTDNLTIPEDISALLDEASLPGGSYSALPMADRIQLVDSHTRVVIREVLWPQAGEWARNVLHNAVGAVAAGEGAAGAQ